MSKNKTPPNPPPPSPSLRTRKVIVGCLFRACAARLPYRRESEKRWQPHSIRSADPDPRNVGECHMHIHSLADVHYPDSVESKRGEGQSTKT